MQIFSVQTLQLKRGQATWLWKALGAVLASLSLLITSAEIVARSPLGVRLPTPSVGSGNFLFDAKIYQLESQIRIRGDIDCLFVGSSATETGVDPAIVERVYEQHTGQKIHCYNAGISQMMGHETAEFSQALVNRYHPRVIFYIVLLRDIYRGEANVDYIDRSRWLQSSLSQPTLADWPINNSYAYRYYLTWRYWLTAENRAYMFKPLKGLTEQGFSPRPVIPTRTRTVNHPGLESLNAEDLTINALAGFLEIESQGTQVILIEAPQYTNPSIDVTSHPYWMAYNNLFIPLLEKTSAEYSLPFWRTAELSTLIPDSLWHDSFHLNSLGALTFSEWLGEQIAQNTWLFK